LHPATRRAIFRRLAAANPEPKTELEHSSPFELLVAVMLSAHTTDKSVNAATRKLFPVANTPAAILALGEEGVKPYLKTVGLYNAKSKNLIGLCRMLVELHAGEVPADRESLEALPGVGRKTANVVLNIIFGETEIAVDTHIFRVANRTGLAPGKTPRAVEDALNKTTPDEFKRNAHHWLILHGRYVCTARSPACPKCIINDLCEYPDKTSPKPAIEERRSQRAFPGASKTRARRTASSGIRQDGESPAFRAKQDSEIRGKFLPQPPGMDSRRPRKDPVRSTLRTAKLK
jgi:endonuclease-3